MYIKLLNVLNLCAHALMCISLWRLKAMATSMKDLVGDPLDDFAKKFTDEFIQLGIRSGVS